MSGGDGLQSMGRRGKLASALVVLGGGLAAGVAYTLSPLLVVTAIGFGLLAAWARRGAADAVERRWITALVACAVLLRVLAVGGLFVFTDHDAVPFGTLFGDEEYFVRRSIWLRNLALGVPISIADTLYAYDEAIHTSFVWVLAALHAVFGPSPYGVRLAGALLYVGGALLLYRTVRPSFGLPASLAGLGVLLFLPSLFAWSIAVLKEPLWVALAAGAVAAAAAALARPGWARAAAAACAVGVLAYAAGTLREGGAAMVLAGTGSGLALAGALCRPRLAAVALAASLVAAPVALGHGAVRDHLAVAVAGAAAKHRDHATAPGRGYGIFEPDFYREPPQPGTMTPALAAQLVAGGVAAYVLRPTPRDLDGGLALAYWPEQVVWYGLLLLAIPGVREAFVRDRTLASLLAAHLAIAVAVVAVTSGNVGTLVRHRALALPFLVWFSGLGFAVVLARAAGVARGVRAPAPAGAAGAGR